MRRLLYATIFIFLVSSCIGTRYLSEGEKLVAKPAIILGAPEKYETKLQDIILQKPNSKLISKRIPISPQVHIYHIGKTVFLNPAKDQRKVRRITTKYDAKAEEAKRKRKKDKLIAKKNKKVDRLKQRIEEGNGLMRIGEDLAVFDNALHLESAAKLKEFLAVHGYFQNEVTFDVLDMGRKKVQLKYMISKGALYSVDTVKIETNNAQILNILVENESNSKIIIKQDYDQGLLEQERERIFELLSNKGYYGFSRQFVSYVLDTVSTTNHQVLIRKIISEPTTGSLKPYRIDSIIFSSVGSGAGSITNPTIEYFNGITYRFGKEKYDKRVMDTRLLISQDSLYNRSRTLETQKQLSYLDAFKFVNINYDSVSSGGLVANIFTSPLNKFQTSIEGGFISASQQFLPGPFGNIGLKSRNILGGLEIFQLQGNFSLLGIDNVESNESGQSTSYSLLQYGGQLTTTFPLFLFPAGRYVSKKIANYNPKTQWSISYNYEDRLREYERSIAKTSFSYLWRIKDRIQYNVTPFTLSYTNVLRITSDFRDFLNEQEALGNGSLPAAFRSAVLTSSSTEATFNIGGYGTDAPRSSYIRLFAESGGNVAHLVGLDKLRTDSTFAVFRWLKFNVDYRNIIRLNEKATIAYRINTGLAYPYGKDPSLPYEKRFYAGGSNSIRAWPVRRIGPGSFGLVQTDSLEIKQPRLISYRLEQGGDFILESSIEYRKQLIGFVDYALFIDAGNIWIVNSQQNIKDRDGDDGKFRFNQFYKEIAVGAGVGLRLDFSFLIIRLDGAIQVFDPAQPIGNRFILDDVNLLSPFTKMGELNQDRIMEQRTILKNKTNINLGIGFPF